MHEDKGEQKEKKEKDVEINKARQKEGKGRKRHGQKLKKEGREEGVREEKESLSDRIYSKRHGGNRESKTQGYTDMQGKRGAWKQSGKEGERGGGRERK